MFITKNIKYLTFFIYLLPFFLVTGPFLPDLTVTISSIFFLIYSFKEKLYKYYNNNFFKIFLIFWIYISANSLFSLHPILSLNSSFFFIRFGIFSILIYYLIDCNKNFIKNFSFILFLTFFIVLLDSYLQYFSGSNIFGMKSPQYNRLSSFFGEEMIVGSFLSRLFPLVLALGILMHKKGIKYLNIFCLVFLVLTDVIVFLSGERTSFAFLVLTNFCYIFFITKYKFFRIIAFAVSLIIIFYFISNVETVKNRMVTQTFDEFVLNSKDSENKEKNFIPFTVVHQSHYLTALNMFLQNPLFGVGPNMFRHECSNEKYASGSFNCTTHPHNIHIQILAETGVVGYIIFFIPVIYLILYFFSGLFKLFKEKTLKQDYQTCLMISFLISVFPFAPSGNFFHNWLCIIFFLPVGFYLHLNKKHYEY